MEVSMSEHKYIAYSDDEREFISKETGSCYTRNICQAAEFDTLEEAQKYVDDNFPAESMTFLQIVMVWP
jgi:hypothetical protein